ncbi:MAG: PAS domain S-box protein, partial [Nitrososphaeraceae archaeon]|nr:PAS domain S-box protein [Nitrososphaeraceae archaeon]
AIFILDEGKFIDCNASAERLFGVQRRKIIGRTPIDFSPELQENGKPTTELVPKLVSAALKGNPQRFEWLHRRLNEVIVADVSLNAIKLNNKNVVVAFLFDITERKAAQKALRESEDKYRNLVENLDEIVYSFDEFSNITFVNQAAERKFGFNPNDVIGKPFSAFLHKDDVRPAMDTFSRLPDSRKTNGVYRIKSKNNGFRYVSATVSAIFENDKFKGAHGVLVDITERKLAEEKLRESEIKYHDLFDSANDAIIIFEPVSEIILEVNNKACEIYKIPKDRFIGMSLQKISKDIKTGRERIKETIKNKSFKNFESDHITPDGRILHLLINASLIEYEGIPAILSIHRDITDQILSDKQIRYLSTAIEQSPVSVVITDLN